MSTLTVGLMYGGATLFAMFAGMPIAPAVGASYGNAVAERALADAGIDPMRRGETLSVAEFAKLAEAAERAAIDV